MLRLIGPIASLLLGIGLLVLASGFLGTLVAVRADLESFPPAVIGAVMSAYFLGFLLGTLRCPTLIRRVGHIRVYATLAAVAAVAAATHGLLVQPVVWGLLRAATGFSISGLYMTIESWLNSETTNQQRGRTLAVYTMVTLLAAASGQYLILVGDLGSGVLFTLAAILFLLGLPPVTLTRMREPRGVATVGLNLRRLHEVSPLAVGAVLASGFANSAFWGMGPVFAQRVGLGGAGTAALMSATILGGALVQWPVGHFSDRIDRRRVLISICFAGTAAALGGAALVGVSTPGLIACAFLYGGATFTLYPLSLAHANDHAASRDVLETTRGLLMLYGLSAVFGPVAAGTLMGALGPRSLFLYFATAQAFVALYGLYRIRQRESVADEEREEFVPIARTSQAALEMLPAVESSDSVAG